MKLYTLKTHAKPWNWQWWHYALLALLALIVLAPCDLPIARMCYTASPPRSVLRIIEKVGDAGGYGLAVFVILLVIAVFSRTKFSRMPLLISMALGAGLLADLLKLCVARGRPHSIDLSSETFATTFKGLFPLFSVPSGQQSFPSGHAATAFGFAIALSLIYPRHRRYFIAFAVIVGLTRVMLHAHFPTDVTVGAMIGLTWANVCYRGAAAPVFARAEHAIDDWILRYQQSRRPEHTTECEISDSIPQTKTSATAHSRVSDAA